MPKVIENSRLTLIQQLTFGKKSTGLYRCICGTEKVLAINTVRMNKTRSCGCLQRENWGKPKTHGLYYHPLHIVWTMMKSRCYTPKNQDYPEYGRRGVTVCPEWHQFKPFYEWAIANGWQKGLQLDKDKKAKEMGVEALLYSPERCQFVTPKVNSNNRRSNRIIEYLGRRQTLSMWADEVGILHWAIGARLSKLKWSVEKALTTPLNR